MEVKSSKSGRSRKDNFSELIPSLRTENCFRLPFLSGSRILTDTTLNQCSAIRPPKRTYLPIQCKMMAFSNELLVISIVLGEEPEELVYLKATESELLVSCSVDTHENYLSRYAYFVLHRLTYYNCQFDFEAYYWPGFFEKETGLCEYLNIKRSKNLLLVSSKAKYKAWYKPGNKLPLISIDIPRQGETLPAIPEKATKDHRRVLGFCLADANSDSIRTSHYPFLIPYIGILNSDKTALRGFETFVCTEMDLVGLALTDSQQTLVEICFAMKKIAGCRGTDQFNPLFELWQQALLILSGSRYTHYCYTFGCVM